MNAWLVGAAALCLAVGLAHSYLGERYILIRLFRRELPPLLGSDAFTRATLRFAWHITTVAWLGFGAIAWGLAHGAGARWIGGAIAATFGASAVIAAAASRGRHLSWIAFAAIAAGAWLGTR